MLESTETVADKRVEYVFQLIKMCRDFLRDYPLARNACFFYQAMHNNMDRIVDDDGEGCGHPKQQLELLNRPSYSSIPHCPQLTCIGDRL